MWKNHLNLHTQSILPGSVPENWLGQNNMVICSYCFHLVASSHLQSHHGKCPLKPASTGVQLVHPMLMPQPSYRPLKMCACFIAVPSNTSLSNPGQHSQVFYLQHSIQFYTKTGLAEVFYAPEVCTCGSQTERMSPQASPHQSPM